VGPPAVRFFDDNLTAGEQILLSMSTVSLIFVVLTAVLLAVGWWAINRKEKPVRRRTQG
jgi:hypothetical protein